MTETAVKSGVGERRDCVRSADAIGSEKSAVKTRIRPVKMRMAKRAGDLRPMSSTQSRQALTGLRLGRRRPAASGGGGASTGDGGATSRSSWYSRRPDQYLLPHA